MLLALVPFALALDVPFAVLAMKIASRLSPMARSIRLAALSIMLNLSLLMSSALLLWLLLRWVTDGMSSAESEGLGVLFALMLVLLSVMAMVALLLSLLLVWARPAERARS